MFGYKDLLHEVQLFCRNGVETGIVGDSELGQQIPYIFVGKKNGNCMIVQGAIHAREHMTALLVVNLAKYLVKNPNLPIFGGIYFVPMVNPDGVRLCQEGLDSVNDKRRKSNLLAINGTQDFSLWKANADGVDLNVNFPAKWGEGASNVFAPAAENFVGTAPLCARESLALSNFTSKLKPCVTLSYHLKGEEVYWEFGQTSHRLYRDKRFAEAISRYTGYKVRTPQGSVGGYKDWCIETFKIPSFTLEVGNDQFQHPFPYDQFWNVYRQNEDLPRKLLNTIVRYNKKLADVGLSHVLK